VGPHGALPILALFCLLDLVWSGAVLYRRRWAAVWFIAAAALVWVVAIVIDFAHH
jgi:hypothetical protein